MAFYQYELEMEALSKAFVLKGGRGAMFLPLNIDIFQEDDLFVAISPQLNISSFGDNIEGARASLIEAVDAFIEECRDMGTLDEVLEEAGFSKTEGNWEP